jgi:hypothetical protein
MKILIFLFASLIFSLNSYAHSSEKLSYEVSIKIYGEYAYGKKDQVVKILNEYLGVKALQVQTMTKEFDLDLNNEDHEGLYKGFKVSMPSEMNIIADSNNHVVFNIPEYEITFELKGTKKKVDEFHHKMFDLIPHPGRFSFTTINYR